MTAEAEKLMLAFKRLIHVLTTGKRTPNQYGDTSLYRAEVHILEIIGKKPGISGSEIVKDMKVTKGAVSQIISKLFKKGLLEKSSNVDNHRIQELYLTKKGMEAVFYHGEHEKELIREVTAELEKCATEDIVKFAAAVSLIADFVENPHYMKRHKDR
jgi:DNA-binding MarR family transcriptional regulator